MPDAADLMVTRIEGTTGDLIRFGSNKLADSEIVTKICDQLTQMVEDGNVSLILDISDVAQIGSEMLGILVTIHNKAELKGGGVHLLRPTPNVQTMLQISKLDKIFPVHTELDDAVASLGQSG